MRNARHVSLPLSLLALGAAIPAAATAQDAGALNKYGNPARVAPAPTTPAIDVRDLQIRLYQFADDSMQGRQVGRVGNMKGTDMIAAEVKRLGLLPAGDNGTYFQVLPFHIRKFTDHSRLTVGGNPLAWNQDWVAVPGMRAPRPITQVEVVFGGVVGDTARQITPAQAAGKFVVLLPAARTAVQGGGRMGGFAAPRFPDAVAVATVDLDALSPAQRAAINNPVVATQDAGRRRQGPAGGGAVDSLALLRQQLATLQPQATIRLTRDAATRLFRGRTLDGLTPGMSGGTVTASLEFVELPTEWARNVVAIIPGSDPALRNQYVAIGAHNDHVGLTTPADKDSVKAFNDERNRRLIANKMVSLNAEQMSSIRVNMDSIRKLHPTVRLDSINNGADDDGSGSMGVLEIAEAIQAMPVKPKRSTLFVWHTGEEAGLLGSYFFANNPTVPMDSVVAQINVDMIGRGRAEDLPGGGPNYLGVVGSFFDSKDLGTTVQTVNNRIDRKNRFQLDYRYDTTLTWTGYNNIYGRSDHYNYALQGVPIAFFWTALHGDYHQRTDEAEFIDYPHFARITNYLRDLVLAAAREPGGFPLDKPKPDPNAPCRQ